MGLLGCWRGCWSILCLQARSQLAVLLFILLSLTWSRDKMLCFSPKRLHRYKSQGLTCIGVLCTTKKKASSFIRGGGQGDPTKCRGQRILESKWEISLQHFYVRSSPSYCSRTSWVWWRTKSQHIISNSIFSLETGKKKSFLSCQSCVNYQREGGRECCVETPRGLLLLGWPYRGPSPVPWGHILVCESKQAPTLLFPCRAGWGQRGWAGSWVTATARGCSGAGTITRIPGRASLPTPQGFSWDPAGIWGWQRGHYLLQLGLSSFPSSFGSEATFSFVSIFFPLAAARFVPRGLLFGECFCQKCVFLSLEAESCKKKNDFNEQTLPIHHLEVLAVHVNQNLLKVGHIVKMN